MSQIEANKLETISNTSSEVVGIINEGLTWVNQALKGENRRGTKNSVKSCRRTLNKIKAVVTEKPTIALFGASQVGKSYMANNLLYNEDNTLLVVNHKAENDPSNSGKGKEIDFLVYLNPEGGGKEATATVTRFTSDKIEDADTLPVKVKLFDIKDILCILCDTYGSEFKDSASLMNEDGIKAHIEELKGYLSNEKQFLLSDDDVYEVKEYLELHWDKQKYFLDNLENVRYWDFVADNIQYIPKRYWVHVFELLWNKQEPISKVFSQLLVLLEKLEFSSYAHVGFEALVRSSGQSILNVITLIEHFYTDSVLFDVQLESGKIIQIGSGKLCMVSAEVTLTVADSTIENREFIKNVDIIDFPGARSRFEFSELSAENVANMLLRGKVAYLFNHYSTNYKTNTLAYCVKTVKTDVPQIPSLIEKWIHHNLGKTAKERTQNITNLNTPPLFVIFTWWNTQLFKERATNEDPTERIEAQFRTLVSQEIFTDKKWPHEWVIDGGGFQKFQNYYLLRDFERSSGTFKQTNLQEGTPNIQNANDIASLYSGEHSYFTDDDQRKYHEAYFNQFIKFHSTSESLFANPAEAFIEASTPGKDGSEHIIRNIAPISSNSVSVPIYVNILNQTLTTAKDEFTKHYHSDASDELIDSAKKVGSALQFRMNIVFGADAFYFGAFIEQLTITESELVDFYHRYLQNIKMVEEKNLNKYILIRAKSSRLSHLKTFDENLLVLKEDYHFDSVEETQQHFEQEDVNLKELFFGDLYDVKNDSLVLAEGARDYWFSKLVTDNFDFFIDKGLKVDELESLLENMKISFNKLNIERNIANAMRAFVDDPENTNRSEMGEMLAHITSGKINEFVNSMGWSFYSEEEKQEVYEANENHRLGLKFPEEKVFTALSKTEEEAEGGEVSLERLIDYMYNLQSNLNKKPIDHETIEYVPMIQNYQRWSELMRISFVANCDIPTYDIEANKQLGDILNKMKEFHFTYK